MGPLRHEKSNTRSTPYTIPSHQEEWVQRHFENELHLTWKERNSNIPRPVPGVKPIPNYSQVPLPTVLQRVHVSPSTNGIGKRHGEDGHHEPHPPPETKSTS
ncbi:hypothetical protein TNIN_435651 [Trichonephila inaurata madagascariensis]|uniref:Uncharacterized protein n=1 Tax=Trichonephila inaurata madagascariensis TaxID=2747483 RepID=A0A8X7CC36_9ARAC|nr:hypothetical protein TNIN_435651 [Trichonephila inaurata madagascariensis]